MVHLGMYTASWATFGLILIGFWVGISTVTLEPYPVIRTLLAQLLQWWSAAV